MLSKAHLVIARLTDSLPHVMKELQPGNTSPDAEAAGPRRRGPGPRGCPRIRRSEPSMPRLNPVRFPETAWHRPLSDSVRMLPRRQHPERNHDDHRLHSETGPASGFPLLAAQR